MIRRVAAMTPWAAPITRRTPVQAIRPGLVISIRQAPIIRRRPASSIRTAPGMRTAPAGDRYREGRKSQPDLNGGGFGGNRCGQCQSGTKRGAYQSFQHHFPASAVGSQNGEPFNGISAVLEGAHLLRSRETLRRPAVPSQATAKRAGLCPVVMLYFWFQCGSSTGNLTAAVSVS